MRNLISKENSVNVMSEVASEVWKFHNRFGTGSGMLKDATLGETIVKRRLLLSEDTQKLRCAVNEHDDVAISDQATDVPFVAMGHIEALAQAGLDGPTPTYITPNPSLSTPPSASRT